MSLQLDVQTSNEWHVLKGETKYGPYTYEEMLQMLQNKTIFNFDYTWSPHLETWTTLSDLPEFSFDRISRLAEKAASDVFSRRATTRVNVRIPVLCHDNSNLWHGVCENLSKGGGLVLIANPMLLPGHHIHLHFRGVEKGDTSFNVIAEILTKRLTKQKIHHDSEIYYAVRFVQVQPTGEEQIAKWVDSKLKEIKDCLDKKGA